MYRALILHLLLFILQSGKLGHSQEQRESKHTENDPQRTVLNVLPGELIRVIVEELQSHHVNMSYNMSQTAGVVISKSIGHEELSTIQNDRMVLDGLHQSRNVASTHSGNSHSRETYDQRSKQLLTEPQTESSKTVATGRSSSPTDLVDGKMGSDHSSSSVLLLNVTIQSFVPPET